MPSSGLFTMNYFLILFRGLSENTDSQNYTDLPHITYFMI